MKDIMAIYVEELNKKEEKQELAWFEKEISTYEFKAGEYCGHIRPSGNYCYMDDLENALIALKDYTTPDGFNVIGEGYAIDFKVNFTDGTSYRFSRDYDDYVAKIRQCMIKGTEYAKKDSMEWYRKLNELTIEDLDKVADFWKNAK